MRNKIIYDRGAGVDSRQQIEFSDDDIVSLNLDLINICTCIL